MWPDSSRKFAFRRNKRTFGTVGHQRDHDAARAVHHVVALANPFHRSRFPHVHTVHDRAAAVPAT